MSGWIVRCASSPACRSWLPSRPLALLTRRTGCGAQVESGVEQKWTACREACTAETVPADKYAEAMHSFNCAARDDPRTQVVLLPVRDGLSLIRRVA